jgi:diguanylate cyclase (GGDEF)-like protein
MDATESMRLTHQESAARRHGHELDRASIVTVVIVLIGALLLIYQADRVTGDAPVQHLYYLPILLAATRLGCRGGLAVATIAIALYHLASPVPPEWSVQQSDLVQSVLFIAVAIVTARLADDRRRLRQLAVTDDLTGLHNLRSFESRLLRMVRRCRVAGVPLAMLVLDLDRLKSLNDQHGHLAGGDAVRTVGYVLAASLPPGAVACRFGGDEFAVAIPECTAVLAERVANEIRRAVKALAPHLARQAFPSGTLSVSVGVACLSFAPDQRVPSSGLADDETGESLFRAADRSLYVAKEQGRNRVSVVTLPVAAAMRAS